MEISKIHSDNIINLTNYPEKSHYTNIEATSPKQIKRSAIFDVVIDPLTKADPNDTYLEKALKKETQDEYKEQEKRQSDIEMQLSYIDKMKIAMEEKMQDNNENAEEQGHTGEGTQISSAQSSNAQVSNAQSSNDAQMQLKSDLKKVVLNTNEQVNSVNNNIQTTNIQLIPKAQRLLSQPQLTLRYKIYILKLSLLKLHS